MSGATTQMRTVAERLITYENPGNELPTAAISGAFHATDKLRPDLATLMGDRGFQALLSRALVLAGAEVPWLRKMQVNGDGALEGLEAMYPRLRPADFLEGRVVLLAHLLGLLVAFIGPALTARIVGDIWPQLPLNGADLDQGGKVGKAK